MFEADCPCGSDLCDTSYMTQIRLSSGGCLDWSVTQVSFCKCCTEHMVLSAVWHQCVIHTSYAIKKCSFWKKWEKNASRPIINPCSQEHKQEIHSYVFGSTQYSAEQPLPLWSLSSTGWQLKDCKCCILSTAVNLSGLLSPVRPRSYGISPTFFAVDRAYGFWVSFSPLSREAVNKLVNLSSALSNCKVTPHLYFLLRFVF